VPASGICRYPGHRLGYAGTLPSDRGMQVPWPMSGVGRYPDQLLGVYRYPGQRLGYAGTLASDRGMQVPWPVSGVCRYPVKHQGHACTLASVRGRQVPWPVSGVGRYPDQRLGYAGTLASVRGRQVPHSGKSIGPATGEFWFKSTDVGKSFSHSPCLLPLQQASGLGGPLNRMAKCPSRINK